MEVEIVLPADVMAAAAIIKRKTISQSVFFPVWSKLKIETKK